MNSSEYFAQNAPSNPFPNKPWEFMPDGIPHSTPYFSSVALGQLALANVANTQLGGGQLGLAGGLGGVALGQVAIDQMAKRDMNKFVQNMGNTEVWNEARQNYITPELQYADQLNENHNRAKLMGKQLLVAAGLPIVGALIGKLANDNAKKNN